MAGIRLASALRRAGAASRALLALAMLLGAVAVALGRAARPGPPRRVDRPALPFRVGMRPGGPLHDPDRFLDPADGRPVAPSVPRGGHFLGSAWAPWVDGAGWSQIAGLWRDAGSLDTAFLRLSQPDGAVLDRLAPEPGRPAWTGAICWFPDRSSRLLLAGGDGRLHRLDLDVGGSTPLRPIPLPDGGGRWPGALRIYDLARPGHARLGGRVLASMTSLAEARSGPGRAQPSLWWIGLDDGASSVLSAGPLVRRGDGGPRAQERHPSLSPEGAGPPRLAWLERDGDRGGWRLRLGPVEFDREPGGPFVDAARARTLAEGCEAAGPSFSADGLRVGYVVEDSAGPAVRWADATCP